MVALSLSGLLSGCTGTGNLSDQMDVAMMGQFSNKRQQAVAWMNEGFTLSQAKQWENAGFVPSRSQYVKHPYTLEAKVAKLWQSSGFSPQTAGLWRHAGFLYPKAAINNIPYSVIAWKNAGFLPTVAEHWVAAGFSPGRAKRWTVVGFTPDSAQKWKASGLSAAQAKQWVKTGSSPKIASQWIAAGFAPQAGWASAWIKVSATPKQAILWRKAGFSPSDAVSDSALGLTPETNIKFRNQCGGKLSKSALAETNPYMVAGQCFVVQGRIIQILRKADALVETISLFGRGAIIYMHFGTSDGAPSQGTILTGILKGTGVFKYTLASGGMNIVPSGVLVAYTNAL